MYFFIKSSNKKSTDRIIVKKYIINMFLYNFYKILWTIIHLVVSFSEKLYYLSVQVYENFQHYLSKTIHYDKLNLDENSIIERNIRYLSKIPKHLVVLLKLDSNEPIMFDNLTKLINWSLYCGISYISFYDYQGVLLENETKIHKMIEKRIVPDGFSIEWDSKSNSARISRKNCQEKSILLNISHLEEGKQKVVDFVVSEVLNQPEKCCDELTVGSLDEKLNSYYDGVPDPDVAVYFGRVRLTYGLLPWQIRLTEFIQIDNSYKKDLKLRKFLDVLYKYSKVEQRFGK